MRPILDLRLAILISSPSIGAASSNVICGAVCGNCCLQELRRRCLRALSAGLDIVRRSSRIHPSALICSALIQRGKLASRSDVVIHAMKNHCFF